MGQSQRCSLCHALVSVPVSQHCSRSCPDIEDVPESPPEPKVSPLALQAVGKTAATPATQVTGAQNNQHTNPESKYGTRFQILE